MTKRSVYAQTLSKAASMGLESLPTPVTPLLTEANYHAATARFWELVGSAVDLAILVVLREAMRAYERTHPD